MFHTDSHQPTDLSKEHVLRIILSLSHLIAKLLHFGILGSIGINLVLQLLVLVQQFLCVSQTVWDVLRGNSLLGARQPLLEVVQVAQETLKLTRLCQLLITLFELQL